MYKKHDIFCRSCALLLLIKEKENSRKTIQTLQLYYATPLLSILKFGVYIDILKAQDSS